MRRFTATLLGLIAVLGFDGATGVSMINRPLACLTGLVCGNLLMKVF